MYWHGRSKGLLSGSYTLIKGRERWTRGISCLFCFLSMSSREWHLAKSSAFRHWMWVLRKGLRRKRQTFRDRKDASGILQTISPLPFSVTPFLHAPRSFAIGRRSGGSESPSFTWGFLWQRELKGSSFQSLHARKDVLPASWGAKLILDASAARGGALAAQVPDLWSGSRATSCAASLGGSRGAFPFPLMSVQVLADVGSRITLLIRRFQYLSEKNFHGKSWAINLATKHNISLLLIYSITQTLTFVISLSPLTSGIAHLQGKESGLTHIFMLWPLWIMKHQILPSELRMPFQIIS